MPIATPSNSGMDLNSGGSTSLDCLSPCASPKVHVPLSTDNNSNCGAQDWSQGVDAAPQMVYAPSPDTFGCQAAPVFFVPMTCMMDPNGHVMQIPCPMDQSGQMVWAAPTNAFHMPGDDSWGSQGMQTMYNQSSLVDERDNLEKSISGTDAPHMTAYNDWQDTSEKSFVPKSEMHDWDEDVVALGSPRKMLVNAELLANVEELLENSDNTKRAAILAWMRPAAVDLALSAKGTRIIQKALEMTGGEPQLVFSQCFHGRVRQLLDSHHGNHVLQKSIVMMPPHAIQFILHELSFTSGGWLGVVKHRFGCRVVERLLEHCQSEVTAPIVAAVVSDIDTLAKHPFANYVVQHILEYVPAHRLQVVNALIQVGVPLLAVHKVASNIIERAFEHGDATVQGLLAEAVLSCPYAIVEMGCSRYGSFTVRRMLDHLDALPLPLVSMAIQQLADPQVIRDLRAAKHGRHIAARVEKRLRAWA
eukprot:gnl/MRDRNA2_/MRDRNA2_87396_c0_seq1.p1 gnl/MRDRNA2_/MRDRNA2_87396_c0~~gnl/MRDRNA2_/MRDRNA2_87396_c0_seq1.p1  ORF type:complete len:474 (+),score=84.30 gnl/MRDRNA2_/MRDRNA2_87396_c0_seq1:93-1514(+)